ncbi:hypothetical protein RDABS01_006994 [Bienertia sinuspersici]
MEREVYLAIHESKKCERFIRWVGPVYGWVALNTNGAAKGCPGPAGGGGIMRDHVGRCIAKFSTYLGHCTAIRAELLALLEILELAWSKEVRFLDVRMDNQACIQLMSTETGYQGPHMQLIKHCKAIVERDQWIVTFAHCYREANRAADWLANQGVNQAHPEVEDAAPNSDLMRILNEDLMGVAMPRLISM